jgi:hypothetical protein
MRTAAASLSLLLLAPVHSAAASGGATIAAHVGVVERKAPMRHYTSLDKPLVFGAEVTTPLTNGVGVGLDITFGTSKGIRDRQSLTVVSGTAMFHSPHVSRVNGFGGLGLVVRVNGSPSPALMARGRFGAAIEMTRHMFLRPEILIDVGSSLDTMATARIGVGYRF